MEHLDPIVNTALTLWAWQQVGGFTLGAALAIGFVLCTVACGLFMLTGDARLAWRRRRRTAPSAAPVATAAPAPVAWHNGAYRPEAMAKALQAVGPRAASRHR